MSHRSTILLADDERNFRIDLGKDLERDGYAVDYVRNSFELRERITEKRYDVLLLDLGMPGKDGRFSVVAGFDDLRHVKDELKLDTAVIVLSIERSSQLIREALRFGAFDFFEKADLAIDRTPLLIAIAAAVGELKLASKLDDPGTPPTPASPLSVRYSLRFEVVPTGIYRLFGRGGFSESLVKYTLTNHSQSDLHVSVKTWIEGRSATQVSPSTRVAAGGTAYVLSSPLIDFDNVCKIRDVVEASLQHRVSFTVDGEEHREELPTERVLLHPMTTMCWVLESADTGRSYFLGDYIAAWVTPHGTGVEETLRIAALRYHPRSLILGYPRGEEKTPSERAALVREQAKAFYDALKHENKITYVDVSPITFRGRGSEAMQKVRLPEESLGQRAANCIDGAVLFASLIELAGMHPVIVMTPGHAFVGWETWERSGAYEYLETTMLRTAEFEDALEAGRRAYEEQRAAGAFDLGRAVVIDVREARLAGIYPMITR